MMNSEESKDDDKNNIDRIDGEPQIKKNRPSPNETYSKCSEGTIIFRILNFSKELACDNSTIYSHVEYINNIPWKICVKCTPGRKLGVFLYLEDSELSSNVEVYTEYKFSLVNQVNGLKTISKPPRFDIVKVGKAYGDSSFVSMDEIMHSYNNFIVDDQIILEAYVTCGSLISNRIKNDFFKNISQREKELSQYMSIRVNYIIRNGVGSDCELIFIKNGEEIAKKASKSILARVSPVFEKMFFGSPQISNRFNITNVEEDIFDVLLLHAYGGKWDFKSMDRAVALYLAACAYEMEDLQHVCMEYAWPRVLSDVWMFLDMSGVPELENMKNAAVRVFARCASEGFISEQFTNISYESLVSVVSQVHMNVRSELDIFDGVMRWSTAQCTKRELEITQENLRSVAGESINMVRFLSMTQGEFESSPMLSSILSAEEKVLILTRIIYKKKTSSMFRLCCLTKPRLKL
ncbi:BTB/POZ domain-containing protein 2-like isoform X2 [Bacillus rossius redtenbacheri]